MTDRGHATNQEDKAALEQICDFMTRTSSTVWYWAAQSLYIPREPYFLKVTLLTEVTACVYAACCCY